jgi:hypothetical protein
MPAPTATCGVCGENVNKRQTISVEPFGRVCRQHPEAEAYREKMQALAEKARQDQEWKKVEMELNAFSIASFIRVQAYQTGMGIALTKMALCHKLPTDMRVKVDKLLKEQGEMTKEEIEKSLLTYMMLGMAAKG